MAVDIQLTTFSETDLAWAAGIVDGEGCIHIARNGPERWLLRVSVCNTDFRMTGRLFGLFGGNLCGVTFHRNSRSTKAQEKWEICGAKAAEFLKRIRPFLVVKGEQVDVAIRSRQFVRKGGSDADKDHWKIAEMERCAFFLSRMKDEPWLSIPK